MIADGWGDEDDLESLDDGGGSNVGGDYGSGDVGTAAATDDAGADDDTGNDDTGNDDGGDAWGFDDDGIVEEDDDDDGDDDRGAEEDGADRNGKAGARPPPGAPLVPPRGQPQQRDSAPTRPPPPPTRQAPGTQPPPPPRGQEQQRHRPPERSVAPPPPSSAPAPALAPPPRQPPTTIDLDPAASELHASLLRYLHDLGPTSPLVASLNAIFDAEYSTPEAAAELRDYYLSRPELRSYTLEKEVDRMEYRVWVDGDDGHCALTDADEIKEKFRLPEGAKEGSGDQVEELLLRASNQSMLADALSAITGEDRLVRVHGFLASAVAKRCFFDVELRRKSKLPGGKRKPRGVGIKCELVVSVPAGESSSSLDGDALDSMGGMSRLDLASLELGIKFVLEGPRSPRLSYELLDLRPLLDPFDPSDATSLRSAALSLARDRAAHPFDASGAPLSPDAAHMSRGAHERLRDNFLNAVSAAGGQTQIGAGLRSAWGQVDAVANVKGKFEFFSKSVAGVAGAFPGLPSMEEMEAAERDAAAAALAANNNINNNNHFSEHAPSGRTFLDRLASTSSGGGGGGSREAAPAEPKGRHFLDRLAGGGGGGGAAGPPPSMPQQSVAFPRPPLQQQQPPPQGPQRPEPPSVRFPRPPPPPARSQVVPPQQQQMQGQMPLQAPTRGHPPQMHQTSQQAPLQVGVGSGLTPAPVTRQLPPMGAGSGLTPAPQQQLPHGQRPVMGVGSGLTPAPQQPPPRGQRPVLGVGSGLTPAQGQQGSFPRPPAAAVAASGVGTGLTTEPLLHVQQQPGRGAPPPPSPQQQRSHSQGQARQVPSQAESSQQAQEQGRQSAPLIGGFLMSGLARLANAAALPDEAAAESGDIYGREMPQRGGAGGHEEIRFYRPSTDTPTPTAPTLPERGGPLPAGRQGPGQERAQPPPQQQPQQPPRKPHPVQAQPPAQVGASAASPRLATAPAAGSSSLAHMATAPSEEDEGEGGGGWSDDDDLELDDEGNDDAEKDAEEEVEETDIAPPTPSRALMASVESSTACTALAASMETVNLIGGNNGGGAYSASGHGGPALAGGDSGHFVSPPRSPTHGVSAAVPPSSAVRETPSSLHVQHGIPRAPDTGGSWSEVSESDALSAGGGGGVGPVGLGTDFVIVDEASFEEDGIIPTRTRWVPRRLREVAAVAQGSSPGTRNRSGGVPGRMIST